jgi:hypothetical protein
MALLSLQENLVFAAWKTATLSLVHDQSPFPTFSASRGTSDKGVLFMFMQAAN